MVRAICDVDMKGFLNCTKGVYNGGRLQRKGSSARKVKEAEEKAKKEGKDTKEAAAKATEKVEKEADEVGVRG